MSPKLKSTLKKTISKFRQVLDYCYSFYWRKNFIKYQSRFHNYFQKSSLYYSDEVSEYGAQKNQLSRRSQLKIAYVLWNYPALSETFVVNELRWLINNNFDVKIYFFSPKSEKLNHLGFRVASEKFDSNEHLAVLLTNDDRNIIHSHFVYPTVTKIVLPVSGLTGIPFTFIAHAVDIFHFKNEARNNIDKISRSKNCLKVFAPGKFHRKYFVDHGVPEYKIADISQTIEYEYYLNEPKKLVPGSEKKSVCAIGRFVEKKGFEYLINAAKFLPDIDFYIYGYGELEIDYKNLIKLNVLSNVHLFGPIENREELKSVILKHDIFVAPCVRAQNGDMDGIPTVLMEAMACGIPVISTELSSIPDLIQDGVTGFLAKERSVESLVQKIEELVSLPNDKLDAIISNAKEIIRTKYNVKLTMEKIVRIWSSQNIEIFLVSYNSHRELKEIVRRVFKYTETPFKITIIDNNSNKKTKKLLYRLSEISNINVVFLPENIFCGPASNLALERIEGEYAIYLCSKEGFVLNRSWETTMINFMNQNRRVGLASQLVHHPRYPTLYSYTQHPLFFKFRSQDYASQKNVNRAIRHVQGGVYIIRMSMFKEIGGFSADVFHNYMDVEYSYYVESKGWEIGEIANIYALSANTKPNFDAYFDEHTFLIHPLSLKKISNVEKVVHRAYKRCNVCSWVGRQFLDKHICPVCKSNPVDRVFFRYLASSDLIHIKLRILNFNIGDYLGEQISKMFIRTVDSSICPDLILANLSFESDYNSCISKVYDFFSTLRSEGSLILHIDYNHFGLSKEKVLNDLNDIGFKVDIRQFNSEAVKYSRLHIFICKKMEIIK